MHLSIPELAATIEHTLLKPESTPGDIIELCRQAIKYKFHAVCVNPYYVPLAARTLNDTGIKVCSVVGFPLGANSSSIKAAEAVEAVRSGAREIDFVINLGLLKAGHFKELKDDLLAVTEAVKQLAGSIIVKAILETGLLGRYEKIAACELAAECGVDFVKTSTGFNAGGATVEDVQLLKAAAGKDIGVKASGGIRDLETAQQMIKAGASRLGTSSGTSIIEEAFKNEKH